MRFQDNLLFKPFARLWHVRVYMTIARFRMTKNIRLNGKLILAGIPKVRIIDSARLELGDSVTLTSHNDWYHVNIFAPCKLLADRPGATIRIGSQSRIHGACIHATKSVSIGERCLIAANVQIIDSNGHELSFPDVSNRINTIDQGREIVIEDDVWIGTGSVVLPGAHIESGSVVGAMSVVRGRVPKNTVVAGNPAIPVARKI